MMRLHNLFVAALVVVIALISSADTSAEKVGFGEFLTGIPAAQGHWSNSTWETEQARLRRSQRAYYTQPAARTWIDRSIRRTQHETIVGSNNVVNETVEVEEIQTPRGRPSLTSPQNAIPGETVYIQDANGHYRREGYPGESISSTEGCESCSQGSDSYSQGCDDCDPCGSCGDCGSCECGPYGGAGNSSDFWSGYEVGARMGGPFPGLAGTSYVLFSKYLSFNVGVQSFKGPADFNDNGNYGFNAGVNLGIPFGYRGRLGLQAGISWVTSDFSGYTIEDIPSPDGRDQVFFTAGIFKRAQCGSGWQWGAAIDIMHDSFYDESALSQIRPEIGYMFGCGRREIGFFGAYGLDKELVTVTQSLSGHYQSVDLNAFFYRAYFTYGGEGRIWAGFTGYGDGLIGADLRLPISGSWAFEGGFNYLIPRGSDGEDALDRESWGLALNLVWTPTRCSRQESKARHRPLFGVANNNTFMRHFTPE